MDRSDVKEYLASWITPQGYEALVLPPDCREYGCTNPTCLPDIRLFSGLTEVQVDESTFYGILFQRLISGDNKSLVRGDDGNWTPSLPLSPKSVCTLCAEEWPHGHTADQLAEWESRGGVSLPPAVYGIDLASEDDRMVFSIIVYDGNGEQYIHELGDVESEEDIRDFFRQIINEPFGGIEVETPVAYVHIPTLPAVTIFIEQVEDTFIGNIVIVPSNSVDSVKVTAFSCCCPDGVALQLLQYLQENEVL